MYSLFQYLLDSDCAAVPSRGDDTRSQDYLVELRAAAYVVASIDE